MIPNVYSLPYQPPEQNKREYVLWVSNLREKKRPDRVLEIARKMPQQKFIMIGGQMVDAKDGGAYFQSIKRAADNIPNLKFLGFRPYEETEKYFDNAAVFLNTSETEGFPNTFLQAWARGVPTVSFFNVTLNEGGVYLNVENIEDAVDSINTLLADEVIWNDYSTNSKSYFSRVHTPQNVVKLYAKLISGCIDHAG